MFLRRRQEALVSPKLIVGLGNPGRQYAETRHNLGFHVVHQLAERHGIRSGRSRFRALQGDGRIGGERVVLLQPLTMMNLSGEAVAAAVRFYRTPLDSVLVLCDDVNLELGKIRFRRGGSAGGHNGLTSVIERLGTDQFPRLRLGIDAPPPGWELMDYVLGRLSKDERAAAEVMVDRAADGIETWVTRGIGEAMNLFN
jgi:PTH1 family peptidyl-tRNA hydrolase